MPIRANLMTRWGIDTVTYQNSLPLSYTFTFILYPYKWLEVLNFSQKCKCGSITYHKRREVGTREGGKEKEREGGR